MINTCVCFGALKNKRVQFGKKMFSNKNIISRRRLHRIRLHQFSFNSIRLHCRFGCRSALLMQLPLAKPSQIVANKGSRRHTLVISNSVEFAWTLLLFPFTHRIYSKIVRKLELVAECTHPKSESQMKHRSLQYACIFATLWITIRCADNRSTAVRTNTLKWPYHRMPRAAANREKRRRQADEKNFIADRKFNCLPIQ